MGLYASLDICGEWGFPHETEYMALPIDYGPAGEAYASIFTEMSQGMCPVDTGYLQSSISAEGGQFFSSTAGAEYAQYVEYGTWKMGAHPFFEPAVKVASQQAFKIATNIYKQAKMMDLALKLQEMGKNEEAQEVLDGGMMNAEGMLENTLRGVAHYSMPDTVSMDGITISTITGEETAESARWSDPSMWRPGTSMYNVAQERSNHKAEKVAMIKDEITQMKQNVGAGRPTTSGISRYEMFGMMSFARGGNTGNVAQDLGYDVGALTMLNMMGAGHGMASSLGMGMLVGGASMLFLMPLMEALMGGEENVEDGISYCMPSIVVV